MASDRRIEFHVCGRVQGVGFRWATREAARAANLTGWVRNELDGSVRGEAQGAVAAVRSFLEFLAEGPPHAQVDRCEVGELALVVGEERFRVDR